jgi:hypothetical protein
MHINISVHGSNMVKTQQLMRFEPYTIPALDDTIRGFFAIFCPLRSRVNLIFLTHVANYRNSATNEAPRPALRRERMAGSEVAGGNSAQARGRADVNNASGQMARPLAVIASSAPAGWPALLDESARHHHCEANGRSKPGAAHSCAGLLSFARNDGGEAIKRIAYH